MRKSIFSVHAVGIVLIILIIVGAGISCAGMTSSPAGKKIAYAYKDKYNNIYIMDEDGLGQPLQITKDDTHLGSTEPAWSPDGKKIAFTSERYEGICVIDTDGTNEKVRICAKALYASVKIPSRIGFSSASPSWSPDGKKIVFSSEFSGSWEIYTMNADGTEAIRLTDNSAYDDYPRWSPDGNKVAFVSERDGNREIYIMNADGTSQVNLTNTPNAKDSLPRWSPDGKMLAFVSDRDGNWEIYTMNADGSKQTNITNNPQWDSSPSWSSDGKRVLFYSNREGDGDFYIMNSNGSKPIKITSTSSSNYRDPVWQP
ncbi:MAG: DUF5050 domain-containing protein [Chloroflexi bacterium]|nr:DUF5050 domain-containing protein [Chloroflexota bacterium]